MKAIFSRRLLIRLALALGSTIFLWKILKRKKRSRFSSILYMSDTHLSLPQGRYSHITPILKKFLESWRKGKDKEEWLLYVNGDYIDRAFFEKEKIVAGDEDYRFQETKLFLDSTKPYFRKVLVNFGTGHDFGNIEKAESQTQTKRIGSYKWGGVDIIWFTVFPATFGIHPALKYEEYEKLDNLLSKTQNAILMTHVPLRTEDSYEYGNWANGTNLTIPETDKAFSILKKRNAQILAIFQGHIHKQYRSELFGIPVFCFPFIMNSSHCELKQYDRYVHVQCKDEQFDDESLEINGLDYKT